jgi:mono/diheme cytochrome c family protein
MSLRRPLWILLLTSTIVSFSTWAAAPSAESFQRCAACHLATGEGIPGAFPPLKDRVASIATSSEGRIYLVSVVNSGLMGAITVAGTPYMGVMPAQGSVYDAAGISEALNHAVQVIDAENVESDWTPFSATEVQTILDNGQWTNGQETAKLRQKLLEKYPDLQ